MQRVPLPQRLQGVFFDFHWEIAKVWALPTPVSVVPFAELAWHLELTIWTTVRKQPLFDLAPATVLGAPERYPDHYQRILAADVAYPLELFRNGARWVILDGYNRLSRHKLQGLHEVRVRMHPAEYKARIAREK